MADEDNKSGDQISGYNLVTHFQTFEPPPEMYDAIGFPPTTTKNQLHHTGSENAAVLWKGFFTKPPEMNDPTSNTFYNQQKHDFSDGSNMVSHEDSSSSPWNHHHHHHQNRLFVDDDDPSLRSIFSCHGNDQRPSQGLSLSLSSSSIALQPFELRQQQQQDELRFGPSSSRSVNIQTHEHDYSHIRSSKYLGLAQELLNDFCSLRSNQNQIQQDQKMKQPQWQDHDNKSLYSLDLVELQRRKTKLFQILQQVDRRYKHYCDQMKAVTSSFESVAGAGAASVYSSLASRAMSRHFRCLRDGIVREMKATKKAMGEKEIGVPGTVKGETPRLRLLDQTLRQQKGLQQMSLMESHPWRPQRGLPERSVHVLRAWLFEHFLHPYPSDVDKHILARQTGLSRSQVSNWFINARVRLWKPMVEEMYMEELKEDDGGGGATDDVLQNPNLSGIEDQKPTHDQLARIDSECLSSIINHPDKNKNDVVLAKKNKFLSEHDHQNPSFGHSYGAMELDFSSYNHHSDNTGISYGGGGVSLTLGLHQHGGGGGGGGGGGVSLAFTAASQNSLFYPRDEMEDCQTGVGVGYSLLENESQTLPYRNLMGAQLLHDLAG